MNQASHKRRPDRALLFSLLTLFVTAGILLLPQIIQQAMIISSDSVFHFNRFYDTAMQMKEGNFQYFISMYGFQESGRIVNALYGPFMAYLQGLLVLISPSWFFYQLLSNFFLYSLAGISMLTLLRKARISHGYSLMTALFYMTTYSVQYWTMRQGFSSWGAALLPLCLVPIIDFVEGKQVKPFKLGLLMALMFQTHILSSVFLAMIYLPFFAYAFVTTENKRQLIRQLGLSIGIFCLLSVNIAYSFIQVYGKNSLIEPFVNKHMASSTIFKNSSYWLATPSLLVPLLLIFLALLIVHWKKTTVIQKISLFTASFFFALSAAAPLWQLLQNKDYQIVELIQFPFRFFIPFTVLFLFGLGLMLQKKVPLTIPVKIIGTFIIVLSVSQFLNTTNQALNKWQSEKSYIQTGKHTTLFSNDAKEIKDSFFDKDLTKALYYVQKSTPDYLPWTNDSTENKYKAYTKQVVKNQNNFVKRIENEQLVIEWSATEEKEVTVPVIKYSDTNLEFNHTDITKAKLKLTTIGNPILTQKKGHNQLILSYPHQLSSKIIVALTFLCWLVALGMLYYRRKKFAQK
ncbi:hypothetical protein BAU15_03930 [Enterococcus sp. JM4C]|nr:hypothetical protein BAU15_03930 [Enterococcus sp. JM4C]